MATTKVPRDVTPVDAKLTAKIISMRKAGESRRTIADKANLSQYAVDRVLETAGLRAAKQPKPAAKARAKR